MAKFCPPLMRSEIVMCIYYFVGCAAFLISAKHEERFPPKISELVDICARCYNKVDFLKMEQIVLLVLEWNILTPTVNVLVREVSLIQNPVKDFNPHFMSNMIKKVIFHKNLAYMPPSKVRNVQFKPSRQTEFTFFFTVLPSKDQIKSE